MNTFRLRYLVALAIACLAIPAMGAMDESTALAVLASPEAAVYDQAMACDELGRMGTAKAVPVLAKLLADEKLNDYARDALERIPDPAAGRALLASLKTLKGDLRVGVITTLGDRREKAAVPALKAIAKDQAESKHAVAAARSSLEQMAPKKSGK